MDTNDKPIALHHFSSKQIADTLKQWILNDIDHDKNITKMKVIFQRHKLSGNVMFVLETDTAKHIVKDDLSAFMTHDAIQIMFECFDQYKKEDPDDLKLKSATEIGDMLLHFAIDKLLAHIRDNNVDGKAFIESLNDKHMIQDETGWSDDEVYQIESLLLKHQTLTESQFKENMDYVLKTKYDEHTLSTRIVDKIKEVILAFDVEALQWNIKTGQSVEEFSDTVMNMMEEVVETRTTSDDQKEYVEDTTIQVIYEAIADCFMFNESSLYRPQWTCSNCSNYNVNKVIGNCINTDLSVCSLCGIKERQSIVLMIRNQPTFLMVNQADSAAAYKTNTSYFMQIISVKVDRFQVKVTANDVASYRRNTVYIKDVAHRNEDAIVVEFNHEDPSVVVDVIVDVKRDGLYHLAIYDYKTATEPYTNSNQIQFQFEYPSVDEEYKPNSIDLSSVFQREGKHKAFEDTKLPALGDTVELRSGKIGTVRFIGPVHFAKGNWIGVELHNESGEHDGAVRGVRYFTCPPTRGIFVKKIKSIQSNAAPIGVYWSMPSKSFGDISYEVVFDDRYEGLTANDVDNILDEIETESKEPTLKSDKDAVTSQINFKIGDRVKLARGKTGLVKFIGETEFAKGEVIGLQLDTWTPAGHNGTVRNKKYFEAADGRGYFTRRSSISTVVIPLVKPLKQRRLSITYKLNPLQISDRIRLTNDNKTGVIRYIGYPSFADGEVIGIELDDWSVNAHDGSANGISVFDTSPGRGIFARRDEVEKYDPEKEKLEEIKKNLKLGDTVILTGNRKGHVKYIGPVTGQDEMIGVELESWSPDAKDGRFDGFRYFTAPDGRGVFIKRSAIVDVIPLENDPDIKQALGIKKSGDRRESDTDMDDEEKEYFVADRVVIEGGNKGYIRYIGKDVKNEGVYGIELDLAVPKGTDGRHNNKRFFICRNNHAVFVRKHVIIQVIDEDEIVAPQIGNRVKLTKGRFGLIHNIHEQDDGLLEYNIHIDQLIDRQLTNKVDISHKRQHSSGGVRRMSVGGGGVYNPKSGRQSGLLDIEDSAYKKLMNGTVDDDSDNYDSDDDNYTALGETIELRSGKIGTIRFIGPVHFGKGNWIGVELHDEWGPHDGAVRGVRYFTCPPKRGIFVKQIKGRKKDDPTRQHLKRRCPECYGEFIKKRDPRAAYKSVGIVCDGCLKHGNEFSSNDWYFQCGQCEQTDFCLNCMLKLPAVSSDDMLDSYQNVRAKFKPIGAEWIFEDIHNDDEDTENDLDTENERKLLEEQEEQKTSSKFLHAPIKTIFDHFDKNNDGLIDDSDIHDLFKASKRELQERLFANKLPMRYPQFEQCWKDIAPPAAQNILEYISHHMKNQISIIFDFFDVDKNGLLEEDDVVRMLRMAGKKNKIDTVITQVLTPMNVEHFLHSWSSFDIDCSFFLRYILTRIQIETERRRMKHRARQPSLIFKPVPNLPSGTVSDGSTSSSDFDVDEDSDDEMNDDKLIVIDDDTLEDIMFQIAAILPYYDDSFEEYAYLPKTGRESIEMLEKVRDIFEFFDLAMNGTLTVADMESMMPIIDIDWNAKAKTKSLFDPPCDFIKFLAKIQAASTMEASNILDKLLSFIHLKIQDVFHTFCENNDNINESQIKVMYNYAYKLESDWRTTFTFPCNLSSFIENWSIMGLYEQRGILDETAKRLHQRLQNIYDCFDVEDRKVLNTEQITELLQLIKIDANSSKQFKVFQAPLSFDQFKRGMNLLHRSLTSDILPPLEDYVKAKNPQLFEETQEELKQQELSEQQLDRHDHFENTTNQQQEIINPLHRQHRPQMAQEPEQKKPPSKPRNRQFYPADGQLVKRMEKRPTEKELRDRGILYDDTQRKEHRRRASQNLLHSLAQRPTFSDLVERGILQNENQQFNERIRRLVTLIEQVNMDESIKSHQYAVINEIKDDYTGMTVRLNGQLFEYKETLNQFQDDVQSREQRYRQELEKKQLVLIHMNGMIEQQTKDNKLIKNEYEEKMREMRVEFEDKLEKNKILNEMKGGKSDPNHRNQIQLKIKQYLEYLRSMSSQLQQELKQYHMHSSSAKQMQQLEQQRQQINTTIDNLHDLALALGNAAPSSGGSGQFGMVTHQYETKIKKQKEQITKLKQQKKEMVKVVNEKMRDLKYMHQQELQKERQIANVLVENQKKQMESWKDRHASGGQVDNNDYRVMQMQQQMEKLKKMYKQSLMENDALRKSKQKLEKMVVKLSSNIVQTARKK
eukprot:962606_1